MTEDRLKKQIEDILRDNNGRYGTTDSIFAACREHFAGLAAERATAEPVAEVLTSDVRPTPSGKYHSTVVSDERLSVGAEVFIRPVEPVAEDVVREEEFLALMVAVIGYAKYAARSAASFALVQNAHEQVQARIAAIAKEEAK